MPIKPNFNNTSRTPGSGVNSSLNEKGHTALHLAVENGDIATIARLARVGADPNQADKQGQTPLFLAIEKRNLEAAKMLVENGASFEVRDNSKRAPLDWAIEKECVVTFIAGLKALGADPGAPMADQRRTAMHLAAEKDRPDLITYLADTGLSVNQQDGLGATPLHVAASAKSAKALDQLLALHADATIRNNQIETPLHLAAASGNEQAVDALLALPEVRRGINDHRTYSLGHTPLMNAAANNHPAIIEKLVAVGASVNQTDNKDHNSLFIAVEKGNVETAKLLIRLGADVEKTGENTNGKSSMLHWIGDKNYAEMLLVLHGAGFDLNVKDNSGQTALNKACDQQNKEKIKALLKLGADPNIANDYGHRPLETLMGHYAYSYSNFDDIIGQLVANGAEVNLSPNASMKEAPLHMAARTGKTETLKLLLARNASIDQSDRTDAGMTPFMAACENGKADAALFLQEQGADAFRKDNFQRGALHFAARGGSNHALDALLALPGMDTHLDDQDSRGRTAMHHAFRKYHTETGLELLKKGAQADVFDHEGLTPLHQAIITNYQGDFLDKAAEILGNKADWNLKTKDGDTLLHTALKHSQQPTIDKLLSLGADVTAQNARSETPLIATVRTDNFFGFTKILDALKEKQIAPDLHRDKEGNTALHHAVRVIYNTQFAQQLMTAGADKEARNAKGETPLHLAVRGGNRDCVALMISQGADIMAKDKEELTALDIAVGMERLDIAQEIMLAMQQKAAQEQAAAAEANAKTKPDAAPKKPPTTPKAPKP